MNFVNDSEIASSCLSGVSVALEHYLLCYDMPAVNAL